MPAGAEDSLARALVDAGFIVFEPTAGGPEALSLPDGTRIVLVGGSPAVPDDVFVQPFVDRLTRSLAATERVFLGVNSTLTLDLLGLSRGDG